MIKNERIRLDIVAGPPDRGRTTFAQCHLRIKYLAELLKFVPLDTWCEVINSRKLDTFYLTARYPDALPDDAVPYELFAAEMATEALSMASAFLETVKAEVNYG